MTTKILKPVSPLGWQVRLAAHQLLRALFQYSVFIVPQTPVGIGAPVEELRDIIDERADDIRVYPLPSRIEVAQYGRQGLPEGIELVGGQLGGEKFAALSLP